MQGIQTTYAQPNDMAGAAPGGFVMVPAWVRRRIREYQAAGLNDKVAASYVADAYVCYGERGTFRPAAGLYDSITISNATLATAMGCARSTAVKAANVLEAIGALTRTARKTAEGDWTSNDCTLIFGTLDGPPPAPAPATPELGSPPDGLQVVRSTDDGGPLNGHNQEPLLPTSVSDQEKLASEPVKTDNAAKKADKVDQILTAAGFAGDVNGKPGRDQVQAYLAEKGKGLGIVAKAERDGSLPSLLSDVRTWSTPTYVPGFPNGAPKSKVEGWLTLDVPAGLAAMQDRLNTAYEGAPNAGRGNALIRQALAARETTKAWDV